MTERAIVRALCKVIVPGTVCLHLRTHFNHYDDNNLAMYIYLINHECSHYTFAALGDMQRHMRLARESETRSQINLDNVVQSKVCDSYTTPATDLWLTLFTPSSREFYNSSKHSITQITLSSHSFDICPIKVKQFSDLQIVTRQMLRHESEAHDVTSRHT